MKLQMINLIRTFKKAEEMKVKYIAILLKSNSLNTYELIINESSDFDKKLEFYKNTYDENLINKKNKEIKIVNFTYGNTLNDIEINLKNKKY